MGDGKYNRNSYAGKRRDLNARWQYPPLVGKQHLGGIALHVFMFKQHARAAALYKDTNRTDKKKEKQRQQQHSALYPGTKRVIFFR